MSKNCHEEFFIRYGITAPDEQEAVLDYIRGLFSIVVESVIKKESHDKLQEC